MGWVSSVHSLFSFQILIVLSASHVINLEPDKSKVEANMPLSASREPTRPNQIEKEIEKERG
jgi:hypothetical protein